MKPAFFNIRLLSILIFSLSSSLLNSAAAQSDAPEEETEMPYTPPKIKMLAPPALPHVAPEIIFHGLRDAKLVALTFDACSTRKRSRYDERITKVLVDMKVPATIFFGGKWIEDNPQHAKELAALPQFEFGNHTYLHPHLTTVTDARMRHELSWTQAMMYTVTGKQATLFRAPFGEYDHRVVEYAASKGMTTVQYDLASGDPDEAVTKEGLVKFVIESVRPGSIVVMHINRRGWHTAEALPEIIEGLRQKGFTFVTVGDLMNRMKPTNHKL
jgi:peptidoglycan/xylan/chitin deacetylase (PgdA/CDA1 family)